MTEHSVIIGTGLNPAQIAIASGDTIVWTNSSQQVQTVTSDDGGNTFTTGPIQVGASSLPIVFSAEPTSVPYTCTSGLHGTVAVAVSFDGTIKPFFTALDREKMMDSTHTFGVITFDLWSPDDCKTHWDAINDAIANGSMPPEGDDSDGPWPPDRIAQFGKDFKAWKDGGFQP
jgi:hypothetical protein